MSRLYSTLTILISFALFGTTPTVADDHSKHHHSQETVPSAEMEAEVAPKQEVKAGNVWTVGGVKYFTCPVMKGELSVDEAEAYSDIEGVRYYHCCPPCQAPFRSNPAKWLSDLKLPANVVELDDKGYKIFVDPVNKKRDTVGEKTLFHDIGNQRYFFTEKKSMKEFSKNSKKYLAAN